MANIIGTDNGETLNGVVGEVNFIDGKGGDDTLFGGSLPDTILGGSGNDQIFGSFGDDAINSGTGNDQISGGTGDDTIDLTQGVAGDVKQVQGDQGDDWINAGAGVDHINGGQGTDVVDYSFSAAAVTVDLQTGKGTGGLAEGDTYLSVEDIVGSAGDDVLAGNGAFNTINGGAGNDTIRGGAGGDLLDGGAGSDWLSYSGSTAAVIVNLRTGEAKGGHAEGDSFHNFENLRGSQFGDSLSGDVGNNILEGRQGYDKLFGNAGNDTLVGGTGPDELWGGHRRRPLRLQLHRGQSEVGAQFHPRLQPGGGRPHRPCRHRRQHACRRRPGVQLHRHGGLWRHCRRTALCLQRRRRHGLRRHQWRQQRRLRHRGRPHAVAVRHRLHRVKQRLD